MKLLRKEHKSLTERCAKAASRLFDRAVREGSPFGKWDGRTPTNLASLPPKTASEITRYFGENYAILGFGSVDEAIVFANSASIVPRYDSIAASIRIQRVDGPASVIVWDNPTRFP